MNARDDRGAAEQSISSAGCSCCGGNDHAMVFSKVLLGRHDVRYFHCPGCGLLQTETPYWLEEAYAAPIADTDTGILDRNLANAQLLNAFMRFGMKDGATRCIDVAGGYGLLTRMLRDRGFDCWHSDPYCQNLFAKGFEAAADLTAPVMLAFEVLEHLPDPHEFLRQRFAIHQADTLILSTQTFAEPGLPAPDWWYFSAETGQHVTFYTSRALAALANRLGCQYIRLDAAHHVLTRRPLRRWVVEALQRPRWRRSLVKWAWRRPSHGSLTWQDHLAAKKRLQEAQR